jgi:peptidase E
MPSDVPTIIATSIGFDSRGRDRTDWDAGPVFDLAADLSGATGTPKVCFLGTATGDDAARLAGVYSALADRFRASHVELFTMPNIDDVRGHFLAQDVIWAGGGSVANLLALWRLHGWDEFLREAWAAGVVLGGVSAGSICWHNGGTTDSFGPQLRPVTNGLGFLPYSNGVHYNSELQRRPLFHRLITNGTLTAGYATDDGVGLVYRGTEMVEAVADRSGCSAYWVERGPDGIAVESVIEPRLLR